MVQNEQLLRQNLKSLKDISLKPPIFIVGSGRCGTTLLRGILGNHPNIYSLKQETHLFVNYKEDSYLYLDKYEKNGDYEMLFLSLLTLIFYGFECSPSLSRKKLFPPDVIEVFNEIKKLEEFPQIKDKYNAFNLCAKYLTLKENKKRWVEKTPANIHNVEFILNKYPDAKFVEICRDPRAVYLSWRNSYFKKPLEIHSILNYWEKTIKSGIRLSQVRRSQFSRIRYEDLLSKPEEELRKLCIFLEEDFKPCMLNNVSVYNSSFDEINYMKGLCKEAVYRWKKLLTREEILFIDLSTREFRKSLGYSNAGINFFSFNVFYFLALLIKIFFSKQSMEMILDKFIQLLNGIILFFNKLIIFMNKQIHAVMPKKFSVHKIYWKIQRKKKINEYLSKDQIKKLQLGSGSNILSGWLNTDVVPQKKNVICLDSREVFPFKDKTLDYIFSEHQIEHMTYEEGIFMLQECYRVLKAGGKIRIATPDLQKLIELYVCENKTEIQNNYIKLVVDFCYPTVGIYSDIFVLNSLFRNFGHKFIYDFKTLKTLLEKVGFVDINRFDASESRDINFQEVEGHGKLYETYGIRNGKELNKFETMVLEARKE